MKKWSMARVEQARPARLAIFPAGRSNGAILKRTPPPPPIAMAGAASLARAQARQTLKPSTLLLRTQKPRRPRFASARNRARDLPSV